MAHIDDKDMEYCMKDIPGFNKVPYSNKLLYDDLDPEVMRAAIANLANHEKFLNDFLGIKFKEVIKPMKHTKLVKTVYIFAKEWEFDFPEKDHLTATRIYDYRDDMDELLASIREADCVMLVPDDLIQDTARFVQITGYDVHYDLSNNEIILHMVITNAD